MGIRVDSAPGRRVWGAVILVAAALLTAYLLAEREPGLAACFEPGALSGEPDAAGKGALASHPETFADMASMSRSIALRAIPDTHHESMKAAKLADSSSAGVRGTHGRWHPVGKGPLRANDPNYVDTYGDGFGNLAGRI